MVILSLLSNIHETNAGHPPLHWPRPRTFFRPPLERKFNPFLVQSRLNSSISASDKHKLESKGLSLTLRLLVITNKTSFKTTKTPLSTLRFLSTLLAITLLLYPIIYTSTAMRRKNFPGSLETI
jgi:hypothetical protein